MIDNHVHVGWYTDSYHSPSEVWQAELEAGIEEIIIVATPAGKPIYEDYFTNPVPNIKALLEKQGKADRFEPVKEVLEDFPKITVIEQDPSYPYGNGSPIASAKKFIDEIVTEG